MRKRVLVIISILSCITAVNLFAYDTDSTEWVDQETLNMNYEHSDDHYGGFRARFFKEDGSPVFEVFSRIVDNFSFFINNLNKSNSFQAFREKWDRRTTKETIDLDVDEKRFEIIRRDYPPQTIIVTAVPPSGGGSGDPPYPPWYILDEYRILAITEEISSSEGPGEEIQEIRDVVNAKTAEYKLEYKYLHNNRDEDVLEIGRYIRYYNDLIIYELLTLINHENGDLPSPEENVEENGDEIYYPALSMLFLLLDWNDIEPEYIRLSVK